MSRHWSYARFAACQNFDQVLDLCDLQVEEELAWVRQESETDTADECILDLVADLERRKRQVAQARSIWNKAKGNINQGVQELRSAGLIDFATALETRNWAELLL